LYNSFNDRADMATSTKFGAFFRDTRKQLGFSLREFCCHTGFDQRRVSRLERGLVRPPKSGKVLTAYAKALKLKPKSAEWDRFMALAKPPDKPRRGHSHRNWVTAKRLEDWAGTQDARGILPQLVRRLIRATANAFIRPVEAPAGEQIQRPGWDALVDASAHTEFVPQGVSAWEMGVDKEPKKKADKDWAKRQRKAPGVVKRKSTFVFVTPRKWQNKTEWVEEKSKRKSWKQVRVYDSASLEEWLERAPAVDVWLARQLGLYPDGVMDVDEHWKNLQALTDPSFEAAVYLTSREKKVGELKKWLEGPPDTLVIESRSPAEAVDFVVAASRQPEFDEAFAARTLIVKTRDAWRSLTVGDASLNLIVDPTLALEAELVAEGVRNGHHVLVCASGPSVSKERELPRVSTVELQKVLETQGVERKLAEDLARNSGGSIAVLKRRTARFPGTVHPGWSHSEHAREVVQLLLAGRWKNDLEGDRIALEKLADIPYRDIVGHAERWSGPPDPMLTCALSQWELMSRDDSWALVSDKFNDDDLRRFERVTFEVLGELDPACDLPSNERWQANVLGKVRTHSSNLRTGLAESLALLGARPPGHKGLTVDPRSLTAHLVRSLLGGKDWKTWASLSSELPLLAEAAPDAFLTALENDLSNASPAVVKLFDPDSSPTFGSHYHTGLLFALEGLAWDRNSLPRVSRCLAHLSELAPAIQLGNNPLRTLEQIFMPWYPQTTAPVGERVKILRGVSNKHLKAGWKVLLALLPVPHAFVSSNYRPAFQNWALQWSEGATRADYALQVEACAHLLVELAGEDADRLRDVIGVFDNLPGAARSELLERLSKFDPSSMSSEARGALATAIREKVNHHKRFAEAGWELKEQVLEELERLYERLEPDDAAARNAWLFDDYWKLRWQVYPRQEEAVAEKAIQQLRAVALDEVRLEKGWDGVLALVEAATSPDQVGWAVGVTATAEDDARALPSVLTDSRKGIAEFAKGYVRARLSQHGWNWVQSLGLDHWSDDQLVQFALAQPRLEPQAWDIVARRGEQTEESYWKKVQTFSYSKNPADIVQACTMFAKTGRPFMAVRQLGIARHRDVQLDPSVIAQVLERAYVALSDPEQHAVLGHLQYEVGLLIQDLQKLAEDGDTRVEVNTVATLEWKYLELLDGHPTYPRILHIWLENEPRFLVELLTILFRRSDENAEDKPEPSEGERARAAQVYRLLNSWERVPGSKPDGSVDGDVLRKWVKSVQTLADKEARREVADLRIGNVFAYAPAEPDGTWPCIAVRDAIEEFGTEDLADGLEVGIMIERGTVMRSLDEGGVQERELAKKYFDWAEAVRIEWPKTAAALRRVGEQYEADGRRQDAEAHSR
jgi:transcriptional regulator with XRE-family HTH domain